MPFGSSWRTTTASSRGRSRSTRSRPAASRAKDPSDPNARSGKQGHTTKKPVLIAVERPEGDQAGRVQAVPLSSMAQEVVHGAVRDVVASDAHVMSDSGSSLKGLAEEKTAQDGEIIAPAVLAQDTVTHSKQEYVRGTVHSNSAEGMNDRIRRTVVGVFHHIDQKHAQACFRMTISRSETWRSRGQATIRTGRCRLGRTPPDQQHAGLSPGRPVFWRPVMLSFLRAQHAPSQEIPAELKATPEERAATIDAFIADVEYWRLSRRGPVMSSEVKELRVDLERRLALGAGLIADQCSRQEIAAMPVAARSSLAFWSEKAPSRDETKGFAVEALANSKRREAYLRSLDDGQER